jgi:hypothetical protein
MGRKRERNYCRTSTRNGKEGMRNLNRNKIAMEKERRK